MKKYPGLFIAFEGLDGCGSSQQAPLLAGILAQEGYRSYFTKEPTNNLIGGLIRAQLTGEWKTSITCLQLLFAADRAHHLSTEIIPKLERGNIVITDRYAPSSIAYGSLEVEDIDWLKKLNSQFVKPDITFLIKVRPKICALRIKESKYEMELYTEEKKLERVWRIYEKIAKEDKSTYVIDGERDEMEIIDEIVKITKNKLGAK